MNRRTLVIVGFALLVATGGVFAAGPAKAALREVRVGNFYFDDASAGDGRVEVDQGDQLRFTVLDGGPGTPHTVDVDEFGIHSGSLASGETYTTPPLDRPGTYRLYCKPHQNRGHVATLIVRASSTATSTAAPTTTPPATTAPTTTAPPGSPTTAPAATAPPAGGTTAPTTATPPPGGDTTGTPAATDDPVSGEAVAGPAAESTDTTLVPVGRGEADEDVLAAAPVDPDSLQAAIGRPAARKGPWTRSVRLGVIVLVLMVAAAGGALFSGKRLHTHRD